MAISEAKILAAERLRDDLLDFKKLLRTRYTKAGAQVSSEEHKKSALEFAEIWLVELATDATIAAAIGKDALSDLNVHFQRLLTFAEHATKRSKYDAELRDILNNYSLNVILPLKQQRGRVLEVTPPSAPAKVSSTAFIGQSFSGEDSNINSCVYNLLDALGVRVATGEKPKAERISEKVKKLIDEQDIFVGLFTRRDKIARKNEWTTSAWVIDEKAYAYGRQKRLILLKEEGVGSIGGIQGDYEYLEFSREKLELLCLKLVQLFEITNGGLRK